MIEKYLTWEFDMQRQNCFDMARAFWAELTGVQLGRQTPYEIAVDAFTLRAEQVAARLKKVETIVDPCLVLMQRERINPHVGVFYRGRILHLDYRQGAAYEALDHVTARFTKVSYYVNP